MWLLIQLITYILRLFPFALIMTWTHKRKIGQEVLTHLPDLTLKA